MKTIILFGLLGSASYLVAEKPNFLFVMVTTSLCSRESRVHPDRNLLAHPRCALYHAQIS